MANLVARDLGRRLLKRWSLTKHLQVALGRAVDRDQLLTPWDQSIAGRHATVCWDEFRLHVAKCRTGEDDAGPIFYDGSDADDLSLVPGEGFVIGSTLFQFEPAALDFSSLEDTHPNEAFTASRELRALLDPKVEELQAVSRLLQVPFGRKLQIDQFESEVVAVLKGAIPQADLIAVLQVQGPEIAIAASAGSLDVCHPLVLHACERQETAEVRWRAKRASTFPHVPGAEWALCTPVICETSSFAIYSSGKRRHSDKSRSVSGLPDHQRSFVQIVADILQSARTLYDLERCRDDMQEFFPQEIRNLLRKAGPAEAFRTATVEAAILFCDLRGSSRFAEQTHDLPAAWSRIRAALGIMTGAITGQNGCIGDFQGDAAMAFWGWPRRGASEGQLSEDVTHACQAADKLRERFLNKSRETGPLSDFTCGIGIAAGDVVAGMLGTEEQRKIGVFGHAVNLAARLESMTKHWGVSILIDDCAEQALRRDRGSRASALTDRLRFLAAVQPGGMDNSVRIFELLLPPAQLTLPLPLLKRFEVGRQAFVSGDWDDARHQLNKVAAAGDGPSRFLLAHMDRLGHPPPNWDGNVVMTGK